jgi:hypothetical protein
MLRWIFIALCCFAIYMLLGMYLPSAHKFAFGVLGIGITWMYLALAGTVYLSHRITK